ncbi:MAG: hypothetical protein ACRDVM_09380, partial [Acidimicrobiia bacterium]
PRTHDHTDRAPSGRAVAARNQWQPVIEIRLALATALLGGIGGMSARPPALRATIQPVDPPVVKRASWPPT